MKLAIMEATQSRILENVNGEATCPKLPKCTNEDQEPVMGIAGYGGTGGCNIDPAIKAAGIETATLTSILPCNTASPKFKKKKRVFELELTRERNLTRTSTPNDQKRFNKLPETMHSLPVRRRWSKGSFTRCCQRQRLNPVRLLG